MHVGLNLIYLVPGRTGGMETYARELVPALARECPGLRLTLFLNRETTRSPHGLDAFGSCVAVPVRAQIRADWIRGEQQLLPGMARRHGCELVHSLGNTAPLRGRFRRVVTIHDLIHRRHPEAHGRASSTFLRFYMPLVARSATRIIVPSSASRDDVTGILGVDPGKVDLVPEGPGMPTAGSPPTEAELRATHALGDRPIVLAIVSDRRHKNVLVLLEALRSMPVERRPVLLLTGLDALPNSALGDDVRVLGTVSADELEGLYRAAACLVVPSRYEGFGLPVLEAMARGLPVACSDRGSLPEVAGDAAVFFDPEESSSIAAAIESILGDGALADRLRAGGLQRAAEFSWVKAARGTAASYERAMDVTPDRHSGATSASRAGRPQAE